MHAPALVRLLKEVETMTDAELEAQQQLYTSIYLHNATPEAARLAAGGLIQVSGRGLIQVRGRGA